MEIVPVRVWRRQAAEDRVVGAGPSEAIRGPRASEAGNPLAGSYPSVDGPRHSAISLESWLGCAQLTVVSQYAGIEYLVERCHVKPRGACAGGSRAHMNGLCLVITPFSSWGATAVATVVSTRSLAVLDRYTASPRYETV